MKTRILTLIAVAATMLSACAKMDTDNSKSVNTGRFSFDATAESQLADTKTTLNGGMTGLVWTQNDAVKVYGSAGDKVYTAESAGASTKLNGDSVGDAPYAAFYPAGFVTSYASGTFTVTFPATQTYAANNIADNTYPMIAYIGTGTSLNFKNVGGLVCINVKAAYDDIYVQSIKLTAESAISGAATVTWNEGAAPTVSMTGADEASKSITLDCSAAAEGKGVLINSTSATPFYFVVPANSYTNLKVTVNGKISGNLYSYTASQTLTNTNTLAIVRSAKTSFNMTAANLVFDLSKANGGSETANCYLIEKPGKYKFPVNVKGNGVAPNGEATVIDAADIKSAKQIWKDGAVFIDGTLSKTDIADGYLTFSTSKELTAGGNILFGVYDDESASAGHVIWSWHIWCNANVKNVTSTGASTYTFMDTNLGAFQNTYSASGNGFFYQWGRKDPFQQTTGDINASGNSWSYSTATGATIAEAVKNPTVAYKDNNEGTTKGSWCTDGQLNLWSTNGTAAEPTALDVIKTMYDPCTPGYHVPSWKALKYIAGSGATIEKGDPVQYQNWTLNGINWQGAGFRFYSGSPSLSAQGYDGSSFHGWSAFAESVANARDFHGNRAGNAEPFYSFGWHLGVIIRPEKN